MSNIIDRVARDMFDGDQVVRDIKFYFRPESTAVGLANYRSRAMAQIRHGQTQENIDLDSYLMN